MSTVTTTITLSPSVDQLFTALVQAQSHMGIASKDGRNPHFRSKYSSVESVLDTVLPPLNEAGISLSQHPGLDGDVVTLTTLLAHTSGQWMMSTSSTPFVKKRDSHAYGSAVTYLRRYSAAAICGLMQADDDGNAASHRGSATPRSTMVPKASPMSERALADKLDGNGFSIKDLTEWCVAHGRPAPLEMPLHQQRQMLTWLGGAGAGTVRTWLTEQYEGGEG